MIAGAYKHFYDLENKFMAIETITTRVAAVSLDRDRCQWPAFTLCITFYFHLIDIT